MPGSTQRLVARAAAAALVPLAVQAAAAAPVSAVNAGGAAAPGLPQVAEIRCATSPARPCPAVGAVAPGGEIRMTGSRLDAVSRIVFHGGRGSRDDAVVRPRHVRSGHLEASVPVQARSGPIAFVTRLGETASTGRSVTVRSLPPRDMAPGRGFFLGGRRTPSIVVPPSGEAMRVELVADADGAVVRDWEVAASSQPTTVRWDGMAAGGSAPSGSYRFRLAAAGAAPRQAAGAEVSPFTFYDHIFPIRGRHDLGQSATNNWGGGRGHQGQDMFARCGVPLAAAQGGVVKRAGTEGAMGNYVVIAGRSGADYVYMHLDAPPLVRTGQRVFTGQALGAVGDSGNASGCHLHFELWSAPGWYTGGRPFDSLQLLRSWDAYS